MTCDDFLPLISRLLDGELQASERLIVQAHLNACQDCQNLEQDWRLQGKVIRTYFRRHALSEEFVQKIHAINHIDRGEVKETKKTGFLGHTPTWWLRAAAAITILFILVSKFAPHGDGNNLARVSNPGAGLQVRSANSSEWVSTAAGVVLRSEDWVRNPDSRAAEIVLMDSSRLILGQDTLAQLRGGRNGQQKQIVLVSGSLVSQVGSDATDLLVRTPAGNISSLSSSFGVRVRSLMLPKLQMSDDNSEVLSGSVLSLGGVTVNNGRIKVETQGTTREVAMGDSAYFTATQFLQVPTAGSGSGSVRALLRAGAAQGSGGAIIESVLTTSERGLQVQIQAHDVSLKRLLEWTGGSTVVGGENIHVSGTLVFPADIAQESLISAIGNAIGFPITSRQNEVHQMAAFLKDTGGLQSVADSTGGAFTLQRSPTGNLSFAFKGVSAGQVFKTLRSEKVNLPELASASEWVPVTLQADNLSPAQVSQLLENKLGMTLRAADQSVRVIEIGAATGNAQNASTAAEGGSTSRAGLSSEANRGKSASGAVGQGPVGFDATATQSSSTSASGVAPSAAPRIWGIISGGRGPVVRQVTTGAPAAGVVMDPTQGAVSTRATGVSANSVKAISRHLVWPVFDRTQGTGNDTYVIYNAANRSVGTVWYGFSADGSLVSQAEILVAPTSTVTLNPDQNLSAVLDTGGHWETFSDGPLSIVDGTGLQAATGTAAEQLPQTLSFKTDPLLATTAPPRLWFVNPGNAAGRFVLAIVAGGNAVLSDQIVLQPHAAVLLSLQDTLAAHPEIKDSLVGSAVSVQVMEGSVAAGVSTVNLQNGSAPKGGQMVH